MDGKARAGGVLTGCLGRQLRAQLVLAGVQECVHGRTMALQGMLCMTSSGQQSASQRFSWCLCQVQRAVLSLLVQSGRHRAPADSCPAGS